MRQNKAPESVRLHTRKSKEWVCKLWDQKRTMIYEEADSGLPDWTFAISLAIEGGHLVDESWKLRCEADFFFRDS